MIKLYYTFSNPKSETFIKASLKCFTGKDGFEIKRTQSGKPYTDGVEFSLSHTDGLTVCAVSDKTVGVDCEKVRCINNKVRMVSRFLNETAENITDEELFRKWTAFESRVKYFGEKMADCPLAREKEVFTSTFGIEDYIVSVSAEIKTEIVKENLYGSF